jgi:L-lactate utilization protein LutC
MNRDDFLAQVRDAAQVGRQYRVKATEPARETGYASIQGDLLDRLVDEINAVGGRAKRVDDPAAARDALVALLKQYSPRTALVWQHPLLDELRVIDLLEEHSVSHASYARLLPQSATARRQAMLAADVGISSADYAIAESGTLALLSRPGQERVVSLLPPVHVALVKREQVLADLFDLFDRLPPGELASNLALITGPSKTGDIELRLTTGVHGPHDWHVVVIG